jgi:ribosomal protein L20A (L18A)
VPLPNPVDQFYASRPDYLRETVRLDPAPEDNALVITMADLHVMLQAGVQTLEEAAQMPSALDKLVNHSISINDHHWNNASGASIAANPGYALASASGAAPTDTTGQGHPQIHTDVRNLLSRAQSAEHKLEALYSEFASYQAWVRRTVIAQHNVVEQLQQQVQAVRQELEEFRPKTLERHSSDDFTRCRTPRRRKLQNHDTSQSHTDPRADRSSGT